MGFRVFAVCLVLLATSALASAASSKLQALEALSKKRPNLEHLTDKECWPIYQGCEEVAKQKYEKALDKVPIDQLTPLEYQSRMIKLQQNLGDSAAVTGLKDERKAINKQRSFQREEADITHSRSWGGVNTVLNDRIQQEIEADPTPKVVKPAADPPLSANWLSEAMERLN